MSTLSLASAPAGSFPPSSNTGGISSFFTSSPQDSTSISYGSETSFWSYDYKQKKRVKKVLIPKNDQANARAAFVDWISFSFKVSNFYAAFPESEGISNDDYDCVMSISEQLKPVFGFGVSSQAKAGKNFFKHSYDLGDGWGFLLIGGEYQRDTCTIMINGAGCSAAKPEFEQRLQDFLPKIFGKITRLDLSADMFAGQYTLDKAVEDYKAGNFSYQGMKPSCRQSGNWIEPDAQGRTFYVGKKENGKELCIYEKGKELGGQFSESFRDWVRIELRLFAKDRVIPYDALTSPGKYLAGSYPALSFLNEEQARVTTKKAKVKILYEHAKAVLKQQFGALLWVISQVDESIADVVRVGEPPKRLIVPDYLNRYTSDLTLSDFILNPDTYGMVFS